MKKDIKIEEVQGVYLAIVREFNKEHRTEDWYAYLVNDKGEDLEMVIISTVGKYEGVRTSELKHKIEKLPAKSVAKVEYMEDAVLLLMNNEFLVSFFLNGKLQDKKFIVPRNTVKGETIEAIDLMDGKKGLLFK